MLRKAVKEDWKDWDCLLPYLLFAYYGEVPHEESTGFSPFELVSGRYVRGPLDLLKETWEAKKTSSESIVSYVLTIQERLTKLQELVQEILTEAQATQKTWYDQKARTREFQPSDKVLVLLPPSTNKLLARWRGPYPILRKVIPVTYEVEMTDHRKIKCILHVNMLRLWHPPCAVALHAEVTEAEEGDEEDTMWYPKSTAVDEAPKLNQELSAQQQKEVQNLLTEFKDVLQNDPGRTDIAEYRIRTTAKPVRLPPYRLPHAYCDHV